MLVLRVSLVLGAVSLLPEAAPTNTNFLFILADDLGWNDVGFHGGEIPTPNLDALAYSGVILNRHYSQPLCSPSRAALLTAKYPMRMGMQGIPLSAGCPYGLPLNETILPQWMSQLGYKSHLVGKWHLGASKKAYLPTGRGFHSHFGFWHGYIGNYDGIHTSCNNTTACAGMDFHRNMKEAWHEVYGRHITQVLTSEAVDLIKKDGPKGNMFLLVTHAAPHTGNKPRLMESPPNGLGRRGLHIKDPVRRIYADMVKGLDDSVGELMTALVEAGIIDNTVVVFISDNGAPSVDYIWGYDNHGSNWPLRGQKIGNTEGGIRTNGLLWYAGLKNPGRIYDHMIHLTDWLPTLYEAAGGNVEDLEGVDGVSHWSNILRGEGGPPRTSFLAQLIENGPYALFQGKWKLLYTVPEDAPTSFAYRYTGESGRGLVEYNLTEVKESEAWRAVGGRGRPELRKAIVRPLEAACEGRPVTPPPCHPRPCLFDIVDDPCETKDLWREFPHVWSEMSRTIDGYRQELRRPPPAGFPDEAHPRLWHDWWFPYLDHHKQEESSGASKVLIITILPLLSCLIATRG